MNTQPYRSTTSLRSQSSISTRAQFSPLLRRNAQAALTRNRMHTNLRGSSNGVVPAADSLTPQTPTLNRWWDPHLIDRLQTALTRFRD